MMLEDVAALDPRWPKLLVAARVWRKALIKDTSTATWATVANLLHAVELFDDVDCDHPVDYRNDHDGHLPPTCELCGEEIPP